MENVSAIFSFLYSLVDILKNTNVPGFGFSFWTFAVGTFLICSGISFLKFFLWVKSDGGGKDSDK